MPRRKAPAYAIVRLDGPINPDLISVVQVRDDAHEAEDDVRRLLELNGPKGSRYEVFPTRRIDQ